LLAGALLSKAERQNLFDQTPGREMIIAFGKVKIYFSN